MYNPVQHILNQFKTPTCADFPDVYVPLERAERHHSVSSHADTYARKASLAEKDSASGDVEKSSSSPPPNQYSMVSMEGLRAQLDQDLTAFGSNSIYDRKSKLINMAIQDMGMGRYQWELFVLCGFGWFADNFWLQGVALCLTSIKNEFSLNGYGGYEERFTTLALFLGLIIGASFWGIASDIIGRRLAFNTTLFMAAVFGMAAAGPNNWIGVCALITCAGMGIGGNLPVDGALFLEFLPFASGSLLTGMSVWWPVGSLVGSMIAWGVIVNYSCDPSTGQVCTRENNMGWRYLLIILGAITFLQWGLRFLVFHLFESPKFLLSKGRQAEAVAVVHGVAYHNRKKTWLTEEILNELGGEETVENKTELSNVEIVKRSLSKFSVQRFKPLFAHWKIAVTTGLLWFQWTTIGMAYPLFNAFLPQYIGLTADTYTTYRNYAITNVVGVPGSIIAIYFVNLKYVGRKGTMAFATAMTGVFICLFTASKDPNFQLGMTCMESFFQNVMYGVLYAYTPEVFPAPNRGTGTGIASTFNRIAGLCAPLVGIFGSSTAPTTPIYVSAGLFFAAFISMIFLPIETRGRQSL